MSRIYLEESPPNANSPGTQSKLALRLSVAVMSEENIPQAQLGIFHKAHAPHSEPVGQDVSECAGFRGRCPVELAFGTSGLRGLVTDITDLEAYVNTRGFLEYAMELGDIATGGHVSLAGDLRPSTDGPDRSILRAVATAIVDSGLCVDYLGKVPTPALTFHGVKHGRPSIMVTGSHIPFDRNGIKFNLSKGEVLKSDEPAILRAIKRVRKIEYARPASESRFGDDGMFRPGEAHALPPVHPDASREYLFRYLDFFPSDALRGLRILLYQHSAVGRSILATLLSSLGAQVVPVGRSEQFVPVDTEAISQAQLELLQRFADEARAEHGNFDAIVSTDGDSDRPLLAGITSQGQVRFFPGDLLGIVAAEFLNADAVAVPISANDAVDRWASARGVNVHKTKIGSPHVIQAMTHLCKEGASRAVAWEANGGFLTGSDFTHEGHTLTALPTRDAALPLVAALSAARSRGVSVIELFAQLPQRFGRSGLLDNVPSETSRELLGRLSPGSQSPEAAVEQLEKYFDSGNGFGRVTQINTLDGLRVWFENGDIVHIRPSGNAPQLRVYAVADSQTRADEIVALALGEPEGILRRMGAVAANESPPVLSQ